MPDFSAVQSIYTDEARSFAENDCWLHSSCLGGVAPLPTSSRERYSDISLPAFHVCLLACLPVSTSLPQCLGLLQRELHSSSSTNLSFPTSLVISASFRTLSCTVIFIMSSYPCIFLFTQGRIACSKRLNFKALCCHPLLLTSPSTIHLS